MHIAKAIGMCYNPIVCIFLKGKTRMSVKSLIGDRAFYRRVFLVTVPILVQNVITNFVSLIDNIMVGMVGTEQMSGVAIVNQLLFVFNICIFGGISGPGIFTAQYYGKGDHKGVRDTFRTKLIIVAAVTVVGALLFTFFPGQLISLFLHEGEAGIDIGNVLEYGKSYIAIMIFQLLPFALMQSYAGTLRETGETVVPMISGITAVIVNVFLNWVLIFGNLGAPRLGIKGAAIATVIARFVECFIVLFWTHLKKDKNRFIVGAYRSFKIPVQLAKDIVKKGFPLMINEMLWAIGTSMLVQCYSLRGAEVISAHSISSTVSNLFNCAFFAFGTTISIIVGQLLGAGELEKAKEDDAKIMALVVAICVVIGSIMASLSNVFPLLYSETLPEVRALAARLLLVSAVTMPIHGFAHATYFTLRSGGNTVITFIFDSVFVWVVSIPVAYLLATATNLGIVALFLTIQCLDILKCVLGFILVKKGIWVNNLVDKMNA